MNNNVLAGILAVSVIGVGLALIAKPNAPITVNTPVNISAPLETPVFGSASGTDFDNPCRSFGGSTTCTVRNAFTATSSVACIVREPLGATSTLMAYTARIINNPFATSGGMGTQVFDVSTTSASLGYGSSTPALIVNRSVTNGTIDSIAWQPNATSSTVANTPYLFGGSVSGESLYIIKANEYVTLRIATATPRANTAGTYWKGTCTAVFQYY